MKSTPHCFVWKQLLIYALHSVTIKLIPVSEWGPLVTQETSGYDSNLVFKEYCVPI